MAEASTDERIVLLDGDDTVRALVAAGLRACGAEVIEVRDPLDLSAAMSALGASVIWSPETTPWLPLDGVVRLKAQMQPARLWVFMSDLDPEQVAQALLQGVDKALPRALPVVAALPSLLGLPPPPEAARDDAGGATTIVSAAGGDSRAELVHDLKEPLRTVRLLLERCERRFRDELPQEARALIQWAQRSTSQLAAQLDAASTPPDVQSTDAEDALSAAIDNLEALIAETGGHVTHEPLPTVGAPFPTLRRVFENLIGNALRHAGSRAPEVHVSAQRVRDAVMLSVRDRGPGIPEALQRSVFEPGASTGGGGLGLHLARRMVEQTGGEIWFDSLPGEGTTFFFTLPSARPAGPTKLTPVGSS